MARLSVSDAIKQSGVARSTFYSKYINKGLISISVSDGKKNIDSSELVRVFLSLAIVQQKTVHRTPNRTVSYTLKTPY